jgi:sulfur-oxidizing protein SoxY
MRHLFFVIAFINLLNAQSNNQIESANFYTILKNIIAEEKYVFDDENIIIKVPDFADNPVQVPININGEKITNAKRLVVFTDYNPISTIIDMELNNLLPKISTNIKVAQGTPLRVLILDEKNIWHIGSANIKSNGGGCDVSSQTSTNNEFEKLLGETKGELFQKGNQTRIKASIFHPMETGFKFGTNQFFIDNIILKTNGQVLSKIKLTAVVSENPRFIFETKETINNLSIEFYDIDNNKFLLNLE